MRLVSFPGGFGRLTAAGVVPMGTDIRAHLQGGLVEERPAVELSSLRLGPPIARPSKILSVGPNYPGEGGASAYPRSADELEVFAMFPSCLIGSGGLIIIPSAVTKADYEAELAVVIGKRVNDVSVEEATDAIAGYMCANDVSARDIQYESRIGGLTRSKAIDTFLPIGPHLVTPDELPHVTDLRITAHINGVLMQDFSTRDMLFSPAEIVSSLSRTMTLEPGDIITTGTGRGAGFTLDPPVWLHHGDQVVVEIDGIGALENRVEAVAQ